MQLYDRLFAALYDRTLAQTEAAGLAERRERLLANTHGRVLEIGAGTGLNLPYYPERLERLVLSEPSSAMAAHLRERLDQSSLTAEVVESPADHLPFDDASFDTVVATLVLCTVDDLPATLAEVKRVLTTNGSLLLIEHVRSDDADRAKWQDRLESPWRVFANGCRCNRDTGQAIEAAGFTFAEIEHGRVRKAPPIVRPLIQGRARVAP